jgi:hypothetical protein
LLIRPLWCADLVNLAKLCWRIERNYQELKQEIGLGHYEGRGWRGSLSRLASLRNSRNDSESEHRQTIPRSLSIPSK